MLSYDVIKKIIMQLLINLPHILMWATRAHDVSRLTSQEAISHNFSQKSSVGFS